MSNPTPNDERDGFVYDTDSGEWVRASIPFEHSGGVLLTTLKDILAIARVQGNVDQLEEIRKAGEVAGWMLQDLDYEEQENGTHEG
mgnify:CR=1 FL=1